MKSAQLTANYLEQDIKHTLNKPQKDTASTITHTTKIYERRQKHDKTEPK
jgi:hypothetical protein